MAKKLMLISGGLFALFLLLTAAVKLVDVKPIGPKGTQVGFAKINKAVKDRIGVNPIWYNITQSLGRVAIAVAAGFGLFGFIQLIKTKSLFMVDKDIILLGLFYILVMALYFFFEKCIINYRPVLVKGRLEASFPSSHTMVALFVMATAMYQFSFRIQNPVLCAGAMGIRGFVAVITVAGRLLSGAHWFTDIAAGLILSASLIVAYIGLCGVV